MTTVWLANTASLLLPVSNLTNLLAADRVALIRRSSRRGMWLPQLAVDRRQTVFLWVFYWRPGARGADRYEPPAAVPVDDPALFRAATGAACLLFIAGILVGVPIGCAARRPRPSVVARSPGVTVRALPCLLPWRLLVFVTGLFLVVPTVSRHGLSDVMGALIGTGDGTAGPRAARPRSRAVQCRSTTCRSTRRAETVVPLGEPRSAARPADRHERRSAHHAVGVAGDPAVVRVVPPQGPARSRSDVRARTGPDLTLVGLPSTAGRARHGLTGRPDPVRRRASSRSAGLGPARDEACPSPRSRGASNGAPSKAVTALPALLRRSAGRRGRSTIPVR